MPTSALAKACFFLWADVGIGPYIKCRGGDPVEKLIRDWNELHTYEKVFRILTLIFAVATMVLGIMSLCDMVDGVILQFSSGLMILCQGISLWRKSKSTAVFSVCASAFVILSATIIAFL